MPFNKAQRRRCVIGARGKYQEWLTEDGLIRVEGYAREGLSDVQIAEKIRISLTTYYDWQNKYPELSEAIKKRESSGR